jgi:hypothetical protein
LIIFFLELLENFHLNRWSTVVIGSDHLLHLSHMHWVCCCCPPHKLHFQ